MLQQTLDHLRRHNITLDPAEDEQQLIDKETIGLLIDTVKVTGDDTVLDVGAGCGNITFSLSEVAGRVIAIEKNPKFLPLLRERALGLSNVEIILDDALRMELPGFDKLVSNLPYRICEAFTQRLFHYRFEAAALVVSGSFSRILAANKGETYYSKLTLLSNAFFDVRHVKDVTPNAYHPPPRKPTSIIKLTPKPTRTRKEDLLREIALQGDKKLRNALREAFIALARQRGDVVTKRMAGEQVMDLGLPHVLMEKKGARLSLEDFENLLEVLDP